MEKMSKVDIVQGDVAWMRQSVENPSRIETVEVHHPHCLIIKWDKPGTHKSKINLLGLMLRSEWFAPLRDAEQFSTVTVVDDGFGVEWEVGVDLSCDTLKRMADLQQPMTGKQFKLWLKTVCLSTRQAADLLQVSASTIHNYKRRKLIPLPVKITCRDTLADPAMLDALLTKERKPGRPAKG